MVIALAIALAGVVIAIPLEIAALTRLRRFRLIGGTMFFGAGALVLFVAYVVLHRRRARRASEQAPHQPPTHP